MHKLEKVVCGKSNQTKRKRKKRFLYFLQVSLCRISEIGLWGVFCFYLFSDYEILTKVQPIHG